MSLMRSLVCALAAGASSSVCAQGLPEIVYEVEEARASAIEFSPDGDSLATGGRLMNSSLTGQIRYWASADGEMLGEIAPGFQFGPVNDVAFAPHGQSVASANGSVNCLPDGGCYANKPGQYVFSFPGGQTEATSAPSGLVSGIDFSPDGTRIATSEWYGSQAVKLYDADLRLERTLAGNNGGTFAVRFSPDGVRVASGGVDGNVKLWRVLDGVLERVLPAGSDLAWVHSVAFSPDGRRVAAGYDGYDVAVRVWRVADGALLHSVEGEEYGSTSTVTFTPDGRHVGALTANYSGDRGNHALIRFWRGQSLVAESIDDRVRNAPTNGFAISPDGSVFAYGYAHRLVVAKSPVRPRPIGVRP